MGYPVQTNRGYMGPTNGRTDMIVDWLERVEGKVDEIIKQTTDTAATVRNHGHALKFIGVIVAGMVLAVLGHIWMG